MVLVVEVSDGCVAECTVHSTFAQLLLRCDGCAARNGRASVEESGQLSSVGVRLER